MYGILQGTMLAVVAVSGALFPYFGLPRPMRHGLTIVTAILPLILIAGGWGLLKWKARGRTLLGMWAVLHMALAFVSTIGYLVFVSRQWSQGSTRVVALSMWSTFYSLIENSMLPLLLLWVLHQPEVKRLWAPRLGRGGFDVIPMAGVAGAAAPAPEVVP